MAYGNKQGKGGRNGRKNDRAKVLNSFAYNLAQVQKGLTNKDSQVYESYERGKANPVKRTKKPII